MATEGLLSMAKKSCPH